MDHLRGLWDFDDLDATHARLQEAMDGAPDAVARAELLTQIARVEGLRGAYAAGDALLDEAKVVGRADPRAATRVSLERGRLRRSAGDVEAARPLFEEAHARATAAGLWFLAADAAHMVALVADGDEGFVTWTRRGIALAEAHEEAAYWAGPLLNNLGWELLGRGDAAGALDAFRRALAARERDGSDRQAIEIARYAVGRALRAAGRAEEAIPLLERAVAWADEEGSPDGWFHEELAEELAAVGRTREAALQAALALPLLEAADPSLAEDDARHARLTALAAGDSR